MAFVPGSALPPFTPLSSASFSLSASSLSSLSQPTLISCPMAIITSQAQLASVLESGKGLLTTLGHRLSSLQTAWREAMWHGLQVTSSCPAAGQLCGIFSLAWDVSSVARKQWGGGGSGVATKCSHSWKARPLSTEDQVDFLPCSHSHHSCHGLPGPKRPALTPFSPSLHPTPCCSSDTARTLPSQALCAHLVPQPPFFILLAAWFPLYFLQSISQMSPFLRSLLITPHRTAPSWFPVVLTLPDLFLSVFFLSLLHESRAFVYFVLCCLSRAPERVWHALSPHWTLVE